SGRTGHPAGGVEECSGPAVRPLRRGGRGLRRARRGTSTRARTGRAPPGRERVTARPPRRARSRRCAVDEGYCRSSPKSSRATPDFLIASSSSAPRVGRGWGGFGVCSSAFGSVASVTRVLGLFSSGVVTAIPFSTCGFLLPLATLRPRGHTCCVRCGPIFTVRSHDGSAVPLGAAVEDLLLGDAPQRGDDH